MDVTRKQLKEYIDATGTTQAHVARKIGVTRSLINMYLKGERNLSDNNKENVKKFLKDAKVKAFKDLYEQVYNV